MKFEAPIHCPQCQKTHKVRFEKMNSGNSISCDCGAIIEFKGDGGRKIQRSFDALEKTLKKFGK